MFGPNPRDRNGMRNWIRNRLGHAGLLLLWMLAASLAPDLAVAQEYGSVGIAIDRDPANPQETLVYVVTYKSPADKVGIKRGDKLLKVDGVPVAGVALPDIASKIRGPVGSTVVITTQSLGGAVQDFPLTRVVLPKGPVISVPPPMLTQSIYLSPEEINAIKQKILSLTTDQERLLMMQLLTQFKDKKITKEQFFGILNTQFK